MQFQYQSCGAHQLAKQPVAYAELQAALAAAHQALADSLLKAGCAKGSCAPQQNWRSSLTDSAERCPALHCHLHACAQDLADQQLARCCTSQARLVKAREMLPTRCDTQQTARQGMSERMKAGHTALQDGRAIGGVHDACEGSWQRAVDAHRCVAGKQNQAPGDKERWPAECPVSDCAGNGTPSQVQPLRTLQSTR